MDGWTARTDRTAESWRGLLRGVVDKPFLPFRRGLFPWLLLVVDPGVFTVIFSGFGAGGPPKTRVTGNKISQTKKTPAVRQQTICGNYNNDS